MTEPDPPGLALVLVRHGGTEWSRSGKHTGRTDIGLTPGGDDEARAWRPWLDAVQFARVLSSPRVRARRTCELSGQARGVLIEPDLAEWDYGRYEGLTTAEIRRQQPGWTVFADGCPGGETPAEIAVRADRLIRSLSALDGPVALFSHGEFLSALAARWIGLTVPEARHLVLGTASVSCLGHRPNHPDIRAITAWNTGPGTLRGLA
jgi:probable phosphoglycerate mutase